MLITYKIVCSATVCDGPRNHYFKVHNSQPPGPIGPYPAGLIGPMGPYRPMGPHGPCQRIMIGQGSLNGIIKMFRHIYYASAVGTSGDHKVDLTILLIVGTNGVHNLEGSYIICLDRNNPRNALITGTIPLRIIGSLE